MRRKIGRILAPVMAAMLVFGGCGNKTADRVTENQTHKTENESNEPVKKEPAEDEDAYSVISSESEEASTSLSEDFSGLDEVSLAMVPSEVAGDSSVEDSSESEESFASDEASERFKETYSLWETGSKSLSRSKSSSSDSVKSLSVREIFLLQ